MLVKRWNEFDGHRARIPRVNKLYRQRVEKSLCLKTGSNEAVEGIGDDTDDGQVVGA